MKKTNLEKVLEHMVNGENELATTALREHLIEQAREIYATIAEEDQIDEEELDLDESLDDYDEGDDFVDDISDMEEEIESEEYFGEADEDEDEAFDDLSDEMDLEYDGGEIEADESDIEDAFVNVEDAMEELRAAFADIMGDDDADAEDLEDQSADEFEDDADDIDFEDEDPMEAATLNKVSVSHSDTGDKNSPYPQTGNKSVTGHGVPTKFVGSEEKGGKCDTPKKMNVTGPQEQKGKMDKTVSKPSNSSEKSTSTIQGKRR